MDPSIVLPKTYVYKANCEECRKEVDEFLSRAKPFAYSIKVKGKVGKLIVESIVNPEEVAATSGEAKAILKDHEEPAASCEAHTTTPPPNEEENDNNNNNNNKEEPVAEGIITTTSTLFKGFEGGILQELAKTKKLKRLEITQNLKMTFTEGNNDNDDQASPNVAEPKKFDQQNHSIGINNASLPQSTANVVANSFDSASKICGIL